MKIEFFIVFALFTNFYSLTAQVVSTHYIDIDSVEIHLDIFKENELILSNFKDSFNEKVSSRILKFQKNYNDFLKEYEYSENHILIEKIKKQLENEQKSIQKFEESTNNADSVLKVELRNWRKDFIKMKIQFYEKQQNIKVEFHSEKQNQDGVKLENLNSEIIAFINQSTWKESHQHFVDFIKHKVLFDFNLE